jgi:hypothetical protein
MPWVALAGFLMLACATATTEQLMRRASFDLACAESSLTQVKIDNQTEGVIGCGKRAVYVVSCDGPPNNATSCTWVLNGDIKPGNAPAGNAPPVKNPPPPTTTPMITN